MCFFDTKFSINIRDVEKNKLPKIYSEPQKEFSRIYLADGCGKRFIYGFSITEGKRV